MDETANDMKFGWRNSDSPGSHAYLIPCLLNILKRHGNESSQTRIMDVGCGNGTITELLRVQRFDIIGIEPSMDGVEHARRAFPFLYVERASAYDNLSSRFGKFDVVLSLEVVEHLYYPEIFARNIASLLKPNGYAIISTPFHGYWKNLALALTGKWDFHHHPLADHGHIKFWSKATLTQLVLNAGMRILEFYRVGRIPTLAKSMVIVVEKRS